MRRGGAGRWFGCAQRAHRQAVGVVAASFTHAAMARPSHCLPAIPCAQPTPSRRSSAQQPVEQAFRAYLPLADAIACSFHRRGHGLIELEDCRQVARMALWLGCSRLEDPLSAPAFLSRHIRGALLHHARDLGRAIRVPGRAQQCGDHGIPWVLTSLDAPASGTQEPLLEQLAAPGGSEPDALGGDGPLAQQLEALLEQLPAQQAAVLRLRFLQGRSLRQAGAELGLNAMAVSRAQGRALAALRLQLGVAAP